MGGKAHLALGLEAAGLLQQANAAFLNKIGDRQAVIAEAQRSADHQARIGKDDFMQRRLAIFVAPSYGEFIFMLAGAAGER